MFLKALGSGFVRIWIQEVWGSLRSGMSSELSVLLLVVQGPPPERARAAAWSPAKPHPAHARLRCPEVFVNTTANRCLWWDFVNYGDELNVGVPPRLMRTP